MSTDAQEFLGALERNGASAEAAGPDLHVVSIEEFVAVDEPGASALLGDDSSVVIPEGGDVMFYGDGGAGKTTLSIDLACHLAGGIAWLGIAVPRRVRVLVIENEGPRPLLRAKLKRKLDSWTGPSLDGGISVLERPWGQFTFAAPEWRSKLTTIVNELAIDLVIAGPLTRVGMTSAGTLQEVNEFMRFVADLRADCGRLLTVALIHHENKGGAVSGAWEGAGDTLFHVQSAGNGHTVVVVQKARWSSEMHGRSLKLAWADGEAFELEADEDRDIPAELELLFADGTWRTQKDAAAPKDAGGIGANETVVGRVLRSDSERFESRTGDAARVLGRSPRAVLWQLRQPANAVDSVGALFGGADETASTASPLKGRSPARSTPVPHLPTASLPPTQSEQSAFEGGS